MHGMIILPHKSMPLPACRESVLQLTVVITPWLRCLGPSDPVAAAGPPPGFSLQHTSHTFSPLPSPPQALRQASSSRTSLASLVLGLSALQVWVRSCVGAG